MTTTHPDPHTCPARGVEPPAGGGEVINFENDVLDPSHMPTRLFLLAEYWKDKCHEARIERDTLRHERYINAPYLDAFDEYDACDAWAGLPIEFFNPGPTFA